MSRLPCPRSVTKMPYFRFETECLGLRTLTQDFGQLAQSEARSLGYRRANPSLDRSLLTAPYAECICHPVDVIEPRRDQGNLQNPAIIESRSSQAFVILRQDLGGVACYLSNVIEHDSVVIGDRRFAVVSLECADQIFV